MDSIGGMFAGGGGGGFMPTTPDTGSFATGDLTIGLPPGGSVETPPGGVAPGSVVSIPVSGGDRGGGWGLPQILGAGMTGINAIRGLFSRSPTEGNLARMGKLSGPAGKTSTQLLNAYSKGELTPTQQAAADQFEKQELAKWRQYLASAGIPESSAMADIENKVRTDKQVYINNLLQQNFDNAMKAGGFAQGSLMNQAQANWLIDQQNQKASRDAMEAIGRIFGSGRDTGTAAPGSKPPLTDDYLSRSPFEENYSDVIPQGVEFT